MAAAAGDRLVHGQALVVEQLAAQGDLPGSDRIALGYPRGRKARRKMPVELRRKRWCSEKQAGEAGG